MYNEHNISKSFIFCSIFFAFSKQHMTASYVNDVAKERRKLLLIAYNVYKSCEWNRLKQKIIVQVRLGCLLTRLASSKEE